MDRKLLPLLCILAVFLLPSCIMQMQCSKNIREVSHTYEAFVLSSADKNYLYRKDGVWYLGAYKATLRRKYATFAVYDTLERQGEWIFQSLDRSTMYYHPLTAETAEKLMRPYGPELEDVFHGEQPQPGSWQTGLKYERKKAFTLCGSRYFRPLRSADACFIRRKTSASALWTYPASALVFTVADLPCSVVPSVIVPFASLYSLVFLPW